MILLSKRKKRFYYPAGIISLIALPILCACYFIVNNAFRQERVMEIMWVDNAVKNPELEIPKRNFTTIQLTDNDSDNKMKLDASQSKIRELIATNDLVKGVHFTFDDDANYWTFIRAMDICKSEKAEMYQVKENEIWVFNEIPKPLILAHKNDITPMYCGTGSMRSVSDFERQQELEVEQMLQNLQIIGTIKKYSVSIVLFLMLIGLSVRQLCIIHSKHLIKQHL